jgi:hypothetical protein
MDVTESRRPDMERAEQFTPWRQKSVDEIAAGFEDHEQDDVTNDLVSVIAARTRVDALPAIPYRVGFTMYGDADVSEWVVEHNVDGYAVMPSADAGDVDLDTRWEHWEDAVRLVNGDLSPLSLYYARRITLGDEPTLDGEPEWLRAVDFAPGTAALDEHRVITGLVLAAERGAKEADAYVADVGMQRIAEARTVAVARALLEAGCADELKGSSMTVVLGDDPAVAVARFRDRDVELGDPDADAAAVGSGVTLRYVSRQNLIEAATGARTFQDLLVNGLVKVEGPEESRGRFARTLMNFARLHGI